MTDWIEEYTRTDDLNEKYQHLRTQQAALRARRDDIEFYDADAVRADVHDLNETIDGDLVAFVANDFGRPRAYRPRHLESHAQNEIRHALLQNKYATADEDLQQIRTTLLNDHPAIHKLIAAEHTDDQIHYHLPEGTTRHTNFLTVREMVGLIDYTTNSAQADDLTTTY